MNPLGWKREHLVALLVSLIVGATAGLMAGFTVAHTPMTPYGLTVWLEVRNADAAIWAAQGAIVAGGLVYLWRLLSN